MGDWWDRKAPVRLKKQALHFMHRAPQHQYVFLTKQAETIRIHDVYELPEKSWVGLSIVGGLQPGLTDSLALGRIYARGHLPWLSVEPVLYSWGSDHNWEHHIPWGKIGWMVIGPLTGAHAKAHYERFNFHVGPEIEMLTKMAQREGVPVCHKDACSRYYGGEILKEMPHGTTASQ
jgi:protein gp37